MSCFYSNVDSLINKRSEFVQLVSNFPDIICLTEILPKNVHIPVLISEIDIKGYKCFSNLDIPGVRGIAIYVRGTIYRLLKYLYLQTLKKLFAVRYLQKTIRRLKS